MSIARHIDHAVLHPTQTDEDLRAACRMCDAVGAASVCVKPFMVPRAAELLRDSRVLVSTVIGFPHGGAATEIKAAEARLACAQGARELDMVVNLGQALAGAWDYVEADIRAVVEAARERGASVKVILETGLIESDETKRELCRVGERAGAALVKTSTGFGYVKDARGKLSATGATEHDVRLMRAACGPAVGVKASGGIRTLADARKFLALGATRLGTSATAALVAEERGDASATFASDY
jgi:deoxyribose-phosphate aldolase